MVKSAGGFPRRESNQLRSQEHWKTAIQLLPQSPTAKDAPKAGNSAGLRLANRHSVALSKETQSLAGSSAQHSTTGDDDRTLGGHQHVDGRGNSTSFGGKARYSTTGLSKKSTG